MMPVERIKDLLWSDAMKTKHSGKFIAPPLALWRSYQGIQLFFRQGNTQKKMDVET